jgi:hypothetical protein
MQSAPAFRIFRAGLPQKERDYRNEKKRATASMRVRVVIPSPPITRGINGKKVAEITRTGYTR